MNRLRILALSGLALIGIAGGTAQAGYTPDFCRPACPVPVVACNPVARPVIVVPTPIVRAHYRHVVTCHRREIYRRHCR